MPSEFQSINQTINTLPGQGVFRRKRENNMTTKLTFNAISFLISMLGLLVLALPGSNAQAQPLLDSSRQNSCANGLIAGDYGLIGQGNIMPGGPLPPSFVGPFAQVGLINFSAA